MNIDEMKALTPEVAGWYMQETFWWLNEQDSEFNIFNLGVWQIESDSYILGIVK